MLFIEVNSFAEKQHQYAGSERSTDPALRQQESETGKANIIKMIGKGIKSIFTSNADQNPDESPQQADTTAH